MEVDESDISSLDDEDSDFSDEEDMLPDTDIESDIEDDEQDDVVGGQDDWSPWRSRDADLQKYPFTVPNSGAHVHQSPNNELDALQRFLTDELLQEFVSATNAFASIKLHGRNFSNASIWHMWQDVTLVEFKAYLGVILNMAINDKPDIKTYFSRDWIESYPFFQDVFSRRRFLEIHWMLHLKPPQPSTAPVTRGSRLQNFTKYLQQKCLDLYTPKQKIAVDESTVGYKGRLVFKTYNPQKPTKWG